MIIVATISFLNYIKLNANIYKKFRDNLCEEAHFFTQVL